MRTLSIQAEVDGAGHLKLDVLTDLPKGQVDVVLVLNPHVPTDSRPDALANLAGKLQWRGDSVADQRRIRDGELRSVLHGPTKGQWRKVLDEDREDPQRP